MDDFSLCCCRNGSTRACDPQTHVHEVVGSVRLAELTEEPHNHRFAGMTSEVILVNGSHIHRLTTKTDFYEDHYHLICVETGTAVTVGEGDDARHVHFIDANTEIQDEHFHQFIATTLIQNPIGE